MLKHLLSEAFSTFELKIKNKEDLTAREIFDLAVLVTKDSNSDLSLLRIDDFNFIIALDIVISAQPRSGQEAGRATLKDKKYKYLVRIKENKIYSFDYVIEKIKELANSVHVSQFGINDPMQEVEL
ncbi:MAG: hypothetical protein Fur0024_0300 [Patescibacteria group bacterium]